MAFIGEAAVSMLLELLLGKSINAALNFVAGYGQVGDQLNKWKSKLHDINAVLNDAEEKQIKHEGVKKWLEDLQVLAYDADDILDEFVYEELRLKLRKTEAQASTSKVRKLLPACCIGSDFTPSSFLFKNAMVTKMKKITDRLNDLDERRKSLELCDVLSQAARSEGKKPARLQLTSMMDEAVEECPQLSGRLPTCLQSLHRLEIKECSRLVVSISSYPSLRELSVEGCEELVDECSSSAVEEVAPLQSVTLSSISKFSIAAERRTLRFANSKDFEIRDFNKLPELLHAFTSLTIMKLERCPSMVSFSEINFLPALKELKISDCDNLQYLFDENASSNTCLLERLEIGDCWSLIQLSSRGDICNQLQHLEIRHCPKLRSLFLNSKLPVMLKKLHIWNCRVLECNSLEYISIWDAGNIKSLPQGLDKLSHLQEIHLWSCSNLVVRLEEIGLPTAKLRDFRISWCENIGALPKCINNFTSLRRLVVGSCSADISFPEEGFPTNLTQLEISDAPKISSSLFDWGFHRLTSLQLLVISGEGCSNVVSFPEERMTLPRSLTYIYITKFDNLEFIRSEGFQHLTSLEELDIGYCPKLKSLPEKDKLLSLGKQIESVIILKLRLHSSSPLEALVNLGLLNEVMFNGNLQSEGAIFLHKGVANSQMSGCERVIISEADVLKVMFTETAGLYELFIKVGCSIVIHWIIIQFGDLGVGGLAKIDQAYYVVLCCLDYRHFM
ncbi:hypothetical protein V6N11_068603 [Hibiscus sabdariffa]|uniref:Rx N-terminal domain-containing protein n=1 Tax=Hibiscus sabdariffa TaxID=183260 RepID=A0ABR2PA71_9ROSI